MRLTPPPHPAPVLRDDARPDATDHDATPAAQHDTTGTAAGGDSAPPAERTAAHPARALSARVRGVARMLAMIAAGTAGAAVLLWAGVIPASAETRHVLAIVATVDDVFNNFRGWLVGILAGLATVFMTVGGVRYVMANGDPSEVEKAKGAFKSAAIGYGLALLAPLVMEILKKIVGA